MVVAVGLGSAVLFHDAINMSILSRELGAVHRVFRILCINMSYRSHLERIELSSAAAPQFSRSPPSFVKFPMLQPIFDTPTNFHYLDSSWLTYVIR